MRKLILLLMVSVLCLAAAVAPGTYLGSWSGMASGDLRLVLSKAGNGEWQANVVFTVGTDEVTTKVVSVKVDGNKLNVVYQYDLMSMRLQSNIRGELHGSSIEGTYKATSVADGSAVDEGTWKASAQ